MEKIFIGKLEYVSMQTSKQNTLSVSGYKKGVSNVVIPKKIEYQNKEYSVVRLLSFAFKNCTTLKSIIIPETIEKVDTQCFMNCVKLKKIKIMSPSTEFSSDVFKGCEKLIDEHGLVITNNFLEKGMTLIDCYSDNEEIFIPKNVTKIAPLVFDNNTTLKTIHFTSNLKEIGRFAFYNCTSLTEINLPDNIEILEHSTFCGCTALEKIVLPKNLKKIKDSVFSECHNLSTIHWGECLEIISDDAFLFCNSLNVVHFPEGLREINAQSFYGCSNLTEIYIPASVTSIKKNSFIECNNLEKVVFAPREKKMSSTNCYFNYNKKMRDNLLLNKQELSENTVVGFSETNLNQYRLDQISIWEFLSQETKNIFVTKWKKAISEDFMTGRNKLRNIVFLKSTAKEMKIYFDEGCHLELLELELYLEHYIKNSCTEKTAILLEYRDKNYDKVTLEKYEERKELVELGFKYPTLNELSKKWDVVLRQEYILIAGYKGQNTTEEIPKCIDTGLPIRVLHKNVTGTFNPIEHLILPEFFIQTIGCCFDDSTLQQLTLPKHIKRIHSSMFDKASNLKRIELHDGIEIIDEYAFRKCTSLKEIYFPASLTSVESYAFDYCTRLEKVVFLDDDKYTEIRKKIDKNAFRDCINLKEVILTKHFTKFPEDVFVNCPALKFVGYENGKNLLKKNN